MKHLHKFERFKTKKGNAIYKCIVPGCPSSFSFPLAMVGSTIACLACGEEMYVTHEHLKLKKIICTNCRVERAKRRSA